MKEDEKCLEQGEFQVRTDLALEERESFPGDGGEICGVELKEWQEADSGIRITRVRILDENGARAMGKPRGTYLTLEAEELAKSEEEHTAVSEELAKQLRELIASLMRANMREESGSSEEAGKLRILVAGLGNPHVTPDALGPRVVGNLQMTRHLDLEYGLGFCRKRGLPVLSAIIPGVMAQTGMETAEILKGIIRETKPELLLVIDALAARSIRRLGTTIQLTDTGIHPGSGVGNHRHGLTYETMGIPVLAIGVPTVVGAAAIVQDTMQAMVEALSSAPAAARWLKQQTPKEQYDLIRELLEPEFKSLYVTPPDMDARIRNLGLVVSDGIARAVGFEAM